MKLDKMDFLLLFKVIDLHSSLANGVPVEFVTIELAKLEVCRVMRSKWSNVDSSITTGKKNRNKAIGRNRVGGGSGANHI